MLTTNSMVRVVKGNVARDITKHSLWAVNSITNLGADYSHSVKVVLRRGNRVVSFYARHQNRLADTVVNLNDGNPLHKIQVRLAE